MKTPCAPEINFRFTAGLAATRASKRTKRIRFQRHEEKFPSFDQPPREGAKDAHWMHTCQLWWHCVLKCLGFLHRFLGLNSPLTGGVRNNHAAKAIFHHLTCALNAHWIRIPLVPLRDGGEETEKPRSAMPGQHKGGESRMARQPGRSRAGHARPRPPGRGRNERSTRPAGARPQRASRKRPGCHAGHNRKDVTSGRCPTYRTGRQYRYPDAADGAANEREDEEAARNDPCAADQTGEQWCISTHRA